MIVLLALARGVQVFAEMADYAASYDAGKLLSLPQDEWIKTCAVSAGYTP